MQSAYTNITGMGPPTATDLWTGRGLNIKTGIYSWNRNVLIASDLTLIGNSSDIWIFQITGTLTISTGVQIILSGDASASNIFWVVVGSATIKPFANFEGTLIANGIAC